MIARENDGRSLIVSTLTAGTGTQVIKVYEYNYNDLANKPTINNIALEGEVNPTSFIETLTNSDIENLIQNMAL